MAKKGSTQEVNSQVPEGALIQLDPSTILADDNTRYSLKQSRIEALAVNILEQGGVMQPVEVEPIASPNGHAYRLTTGFYRHAAVMHLNTTAGAGLTLPAIVHPIDNTTPVIRLKRQISENIERESMSPMDTAIAIKKLLDADVPKMDVRLIFARSKKGAKVQPASNSYINMMLSFLSFPAKIRNKIHDGTLGVKAAYELTRQPAEKHDAILEAAERERTKEIEREERDEERLLADQKRLEARNARVAEAQLDVDKAKKINDEAQVKYENTTKAADECYKIAQGKHPDAKAKKQAESQFKAAFQARKDAEADATEAQVQYEKAMVALTKLTQVTKKEAPAKAAPKKDAAPKAVSQEQVRNAAQELGVTSAEPVPLNGKEMRKVVEELALPGDNEKLRAIGRVFVARFAGISTPSEFIKELAKIVGK